MNVYSYIPIGSSYVALDAYGSICGVLRPVPCLDIPKAKTSLKSNPDASYAHLLERMERRNEKRNAYRRNKKLEKKPKTP